MQMAPFRALGRASSDPLGGLRRFASRSSNAANRCASRPFATSRKCERADSRPRY